MPVSAYRTRKSENGFGSWREVNSYRRQPCSSLLLCAERVDFYEFGHICSKPFVPTAGLLAITDLQHAVERLLQTPAIIRSDHQFQYRFAWGRRINLIHYPRRDIPVGAAYFQKTGATPITISVNALRTASELFNF